MSFVTADTFEVLYNLSNSEILSDGLSNANVTVFIYE